MKLIVGLGNTGEKYEKSRHNIGFMVVDEIAKNLSNFNFHFSMDKKVNALVLKLKHGDKNLILVKPQTMMNASGYAVKKLWEWVVSCESGFKSGDYGNLWVIHDDLDLPLGKIKITQGHGSAGHHGIDSIAEELETTDFVRFRVGISNPERFEEREKYYRRVADYVLKDFEGKEAVEAEKAIIKTAKAVKYALENGLANTSNKYNSK